MSNINHHLAMSGLETWGDSQVYARITTRVELKFRISDIKQHVRQCFGCKLGRLGD